MRTQQADGIFDVRAAVTRSLLGWGLVAGPFYLTAAVVHALWRPGFDFSRHAISLLMLTDTGWIQQANLILVGLMVLATAVGFASSIRTVGGRWVSALTGLFGVSLFGSAIFPPDPMAGFPAGAEQGATFSGIMHLAFGALGFVALGVAAIVFARWAGARGGRRGRVLSLVSGIVVILGFMGGGALGTTTVGVVSLWVAVVTGFAWLFGASLFAYRTVPHPDGDRR